MLTRSSSSSSRRSSPPASSSSSTAASSSSATDSTLNLHRQFGRDTALGRSLFCIYNKKLTYDPNVAVSTRQAQRSPQQEAEEKSREEKEEIRRRLTRYTVRTRLVRKEDEDDRERRLRALAAGRGRRSERVIREEQRARQGEAEWQPLPPHLLVSADEKKRDLQEAMSGVKAMRQKLREERGRRSVEEEKEEASSAAASDEAARLLREIDDRQRFLDEMRGAGKAAEHETAITAEIAQLMRELTLADAGDARHRQRR